MNLYLVLFIFTVSVINCEQQFNWHDVKNGQNIIIVPQTTNITSETHRSGTGRIFKGEDVTNIKEFSYQIGLLLSHKRGFQTWCGGSIISNNHILTAAHCLQDILSAKLYLGVINKDKPEQGSQIIDLKADNFIIHEGYQTGAVYNDLGLIKLNNELKFSDSIQPIDLLTPEEGTKIDGMTALISGWGLTSDRGGGPPPKLQYTKTKLWPNNNCQAKFKTLPKPIDEVKTDNTICADPSEPSGICEGDSGGPVVVLIQGRRVQVGVNSFIVSTGNSCENTLVRVFARLSKYLDWICSKTKICKK